MPSPQFPSNSEIMATPCHCLYTASRVRLNESFFQSQGDQQAFLQKVGKVGEGGRKRKGTKVKLSPISAFAPVQKAEGQTVTWQCLWYPNQTPLQFCETDRLLQNSLLEMRPIPELGSHEGLPRHGHGGDVSVPWTASFPSRPTPLRLSSRPVPSGHTSPQVWVRRAGQLSTSWFGFSAVAFFLSKQLALYEKRRSGFPMLCY